MRPEDVVRLNALEKENARLSGSSARTVSASRFVVSERHACRVATEPVPRSGTNGASSEEALLRQRLEFIARRNPRYGYRRIHAILRRDGWLCNCKQVQRL